MSVRFGFEKRVVAELEDISVSGLQFESAEAKPPGSKLDFELSSDGGQIRGKGEVVWCHLRSQTEGWRVGVRFAELETGSRELLDALLHEFGPLSGSEIDSERQLEEQQQQASESGTVSEAAMSEVEGLREARLSNPSAAEGS